MARFSPNIIRVVSLDLTGTIFQYSHPIGELYCTAAQKVNFPVKLEADRVHKAFKAAYKQTSQQYPCFGFHQNFTERQWWREVVKGTLHISSPLRSYSDAEFENYFRKVYQDFSSLSTFTVYPDAAALLTWLKESKYVRGVVTNAPLRTVETILPLLSYHDHFHYAVSCCDVGYEKPDHRLFDHAYEQARKLLPDLKREEILHVGDDLELDYFGATNAGHQALRIGKRLSTL